MEKNWKENYLGVKEHQRFSCRQKKKEIGKAWWWGERKFMGTKKWGKYLRRQNRTGKKKKMNKYEKKQINTWIPILNKVDEFEKGNLMKLHEGKK